MAEFGMVIQVGDKHISSIFLGAQPRPHPKGMGAASPTFFGIPTYAKRV